MKKNLVIVESPAKAKTISKYLGAGYEVKSCMGHIIDLPKKAFGVDIEDGYKTKYEIIPGRKKLVSELKKNAKDKEKVFIATDPDREGEAIGWHLKERLRIDDERCLRVSFHEITQRAIQEAFRLPRHFDRDKIQAQQTRRILDRIVGYFLSPLLWKKIFRGLSAGRVQSVALRVIVEREREIQKFVPQEYWHVDVDLSKQETHGERFAAHLEKHHGGKITIHNKQEADAIAEKIRNASFVVDGVKVQKRKKSPPPPLITSSLQQEAFNKLSFSTTKTMYVAQELYEGVELGEEGATGLITYMRTDSMRIAKVALDEMRALIEKKFGKDYVPEKPNTYKSKASAQEAHEAIRPTDPAREPKSIKHFLSPDQYKLYELIWKRAIASQMKPAEYQVTSVDILAHDYLFRTSGSHVLFQGFGILYQLEIDEEKSSFPMLEQGEDLTWHDTKLSQHFTKPPARYSEGSLVRTLEELGVGRPSTYSPVIRTIIARNYVRRNKGYLSPTELGFKVNDLLVEYFPKVMNVEFTARMEEELDKVEDGKYNWVNILNEFYHPFKERLDHASKTIQKTVEYYDDTCDTCGKQVVIKWGRRGKFLSCSDYPRCKFSKPITTGVSCPEENCGGVLIERRSKKGRLFYGCSNFPKCHFTSNKLPE